MNISKIIFYTMLSVATHGTLCAENCPNFAQSNFHIVDKIGENALTLQQFMTTTPINTSIVVVHGHDLYSIEAHHLRPLPASCWQQMQGFLNS